MDKNKIERAYNLRHWYMNDKQQAEYYHAINELNTEEKIELIRKLTESLSEAEAQAFEAGEYDED